MGLLTDIYNTVAKFFRQSDEPVIGEASKAVAANRLKLVLMQDRTNLTPKVLEQMRSEMIDLLSKYLEMDKDMLELNFEQEGDQVALMLSIPVIRAKDEDEIEAARIKTEEDEDFEEDSEDSENESEESEEFEEEAVTQEVKPKKRRSKKVTAPEELDSSHQSEAEFQEESNQENSEQETVCENQEG